LVQWIGSPADEASWEDVSHFQACYPEFHLEDKVAFDGERNDTSPSMESSIPAEKGPNFEEIEASQYW